MLGSGMLMSGCGGGGSRCGRPGVSGFSIPGNPGTVGGSEGGTLTGGSNSGTVALMTSAELIEDGIASKGPDDMVTSFRKLFEDKFMIQNTGTC